MEEKKSEWVNGKKHFSKSGWALLVGTLIPAVISAVIRFWIQGEIQTAGVLPPVLENPFVSWAVSFLPMYGVGIPAAILILHALPAESGEVKKMGIKSFLIAFIMCSPLTFGGSIAGNLAANLLSGGRAVNNVVEIVSQMEPLTILTMILIAPVMEELIFRKMLIDRTMRFGEKNAILFSALAFGLFHCNIYQIFYAFGIGLIFGYVYVRTRNIRYTMLMHFGINFLSGVVGAALINLVDEDILRIIMNQDTETVMEFLTENPELLSSLFQSMIPLFINNFVQIGLAIAGAVLLGIRKERFFFLPAEEELPADSRFSAIYGNAGVILFAIATVAQMIYVLIQCCL